MNIKKAAAINHRKYEPKFKQLAKTNRKKPTDAEKKLWFAIKDNLRGIKIRRQFSIDNKYIADFVFLEKRLIIEVDGGQHNENAEDIERSKYLKNQGFKVVRFWNNEVLENINACLEVIMEELRK